MKKSELTQLLAQYKPEKLFSFFHIVSLVREESKEIKDLKMILVRVSALSSDAELPDDIVTALKQVVTTATSHDEPTVTTLQQLHVYLHPTLFDFKAPWKWIDLQARLANMSTSMILPTFFRDCLSPVLDIVTASRLARTCKAGKFVTLNPDSEIYQKSAARLLELVMKGEQDAAEAMITSSPHLLGARSEATDYSCRTILTKPLKYAVWAGDWYMYQMLLKHMPPKLVQEQIKDLTENGLGENGEHGPRFDFSDLFTAYMAFIKRSDEVWAPIRTRTRTNAEYAELDRLWETLYKEQVKLPAHVIHQFMHPERSFLIYGKPPEFNEPKLPRNSKLSDGSSVFSKAGEYVFGSNFGLIRYNYPGRECRRTRHGHATRRVPSDFAALSRLVEVITINHQQTFKEALSPSIGLGATSSTAGLK